MFLLDDFEEWAEKVLNGTAWNYYKSAADREAGRAAKQPGT
jgi:L-lactate dehydrogenase (cytochrome)